MKQKSTKILVILIAIILVLGAIMIYTKGLAFELKYQDRLKAVDFFYENGNPQHKEVLAYLKAKRLYNQGETAGYNGYFVSITNMSDLLRENRFLQADEEYSNKLRPYVLDV